MTFGERLRSLREDSDEKQKDIADLIFVSNKVISDYERGVHFPRDEKAIIALAKHFGVSVDYLFGVTDVKNGEEDIQLLRTYNRLSNEQKREVLDFIEYLINKKEQNG